MALKSECGYIERMSKILEYMAIALAVLTVCLVPY